MTPPDEKEFYEIAGGEVCVWVEKNGPVMLKAISGNDPVELTGKQALRLAEILLKLAKESDD